MTATAPNADIQPTAEHLEQVDQFAEELLDATAGVFKIFSIYLGHKLGYYPALAANAPVTSLELAEICHSHERFCREWLEQQTVIGILRVDDPSAGPFDRRYALPAAAAEVLTRQDSPNYLACLPQMLAGAVRPMPQIVDAYRDGSGVAFKDYGADMRHGQGAINRMSFLELLGAQWVPAMPDIHARLCTAQADVKVADYGCGLGWSAIGMAKTYPGITIDAFDSDPASIEEAKHNAVLHHVADRVNFSCVDVATLKLERGYDLILCCETLHDMADPVAALRTAHRLLAEDGAVLVIDERVAETFGGDGDDIEWMMYGWSILHCLPVGMADGAEHRCGGTGTVMRPPTLRRYAQQAGFNNVEVLPVDNLFFRLYRLHG